MSDEDTIGWPDPFDGQVRQLDFVSAVRSIEKHSEKPRIGTAVRISDEVLRLSQKPTLSFTGVPLEGVEPNKGAHDVRLFCNFLGLFGTNGPLPLHFTEYADHRQRHAKDDTFYEFIDLFNHRMLSLFYRSIADFDPVINQDRPSRNQFVPIVGALGGLRMDRSQNRDQMPDYAKLFLVNWMGNSVKSPDGIRSVVREYFGIESRVHEFVGGWISLAKDAWLRLGDRDEPAALGVSAYLGKRVWNIGHRFSIQLGPLSWPDYLSFKPGGKRLAEFYDVIRNYVGDEWEWDLHLELDQSEAKSMKLDRSGMLGFTSWLGSSKELTDADRTTVISHGVIRAAVHGH